VWKPPSAPSKKHPKSYSCCFRNRQSGSRNWERRTHPGQPRQPRECINFFLIPTSSEVGH
jgi:hypothetical protein